jgi:hypothetical protein
MSKPAVIKAKSRIKTQNKRQPPQAQSLESVYERLSKLLSRHAPPFRLILTIRVPRDA